MIFRQKQHKLKLTFRYFARMKKKGWTASDENGKLRNVICKPSQEMKNSALGHT